MEGRGLRQCFFKYDFPFSSATCVDQLRLVAWLAGSTPLPCPLSVSGILNRFPFTARRLTRSWGERGFAGLCITISISIRLVQRKSQKYCCTFLPLTDQLYSFTWSIKVETQIRVPGHRYICFCADWIKHMHSGQIGHFCTILCSWDHISIYLIAMKVKPASPLIKVIISYCSIYSV